MFGKFISLVWLDIYESIKPFLSIIGLIVGGYIVLFGGTASFGFIMSYLPIPLFKSLLEKGANENDMFSCYLAIGVFAWLTAGVIFLIYCIFDYLRKKWRESKLDPQ